MSTETRTTEAEQTPSGRKFTFPSAFTVLFVVTIAVWLLAFIIPTGTYDQEDGAPVPGQLPPRRRRAVLHGPVDGAVHLTDQRPVRRREPGHRLHRAIRDR